MKIERIQSPNSGGSIPVLRRTDGQESDNGSYVGATNSDPQHNKGGRYYPPKEQNAEKNTSPVLHKSDGIPALATSEERSPLLDITV